MVELLLFFFIGIFLYGIVVLVMIFLGRRKSNSNEDYVANRSISELIDSLITTDIKCFMSQEDLMNSSLPDNERLKKAIDAQRLNLRRRELMKAIDNKLFDRSGKFIDYERTYKGK